MKRTFIFLMVVAAISGCATVHESYSSDGRKAYTLNCSGLARGWDKCLQAAGDLCKSTGYDVLDRSDENASMVSGGFSGGSGGFSGAHTHERSMVVTCKKPAA